MMARFLDRLSPYQLKKSRVGPPPPPLTKLSGSAHFCKQLGPISESMPFDILLKVFLILFWEKVN